MVLPEMKHICDVPTIFISKCNKINEKSIQKILDNAIKNKSMLLKDFYNILYSIDTKNATCKVTNTQQKDLTEFINKIKSRNKITPCMTLVVDNGNEYFIDKDISVSSIPAVLGFCSKYFDKNDDIRQRDYDVLSNILKEDITKYTIIINYGKSSWIIRFQYSGNELRGGEFTVSKKSNKYHSKCGKHIHINNEHIDIV